MRRYRGFICDSARWEHLVLRPDDIIITTPAKCGTTWLQTIVGMLVLGRVDLGAPLGELSPWLDMQTRPIDEVVALLDAQQHRRWIKTHTPLDGLPVSDAVTYLCCVRHPLDVALSDFDHRQNMDTEHAAALRLAAAGDADLAELPPIERPTEPAAYLRWWIDDETPPTGSTVNLAEVAAQAAGYWAARHRPNVHLFHYADLVADRPGQARRIADALAFDPPPELLEAVVAASGIDAMRSRASDLAPDAHLGLWRDDRAFFRQGGRRAWAELLTDDGLAHHQERLLALVGPEVAAWLHHDPI